MKNQIILKAVNSHNQGVATFSPCKDRDNGGYYGVESLSEEERRKAKFIIDENTRFKVRHGQVINLNDPYQAACWKFLQHDPRILASEEDIKSNPLALFYISDEEAVLTKSISVRKRKLVLLNWVESLLPEEKRQVAELLGFKTAWNSDLQVSDFLLAKGEGSDYEKLEQVWEWWKDGYAKKLQFINLLLDKKLVEYDHTSKLYYYGSPRTYMGKSKDEVVAYLEMAANQEVTRQFYAQMQLAKVDELAKVDLATHTISYPAASNQKSTVLDSIVATMKKENTPVHQVKNQTATEENNQAKKVVVSTSKKRGRPRKDTQATQPAANPADFMDSMNPPEAANQTYLNIF